MRIASAASAFPKHYYTQKVLLDRLQDYWGDQLKNPLLLARLHRNVTVDGRYLAGAMAGLAVLLENREHFFVKRHLR